MTTDIPPKTDPEGLALRAAPQPVTRLSRRMLIIIAATLAIAILGATLWSLQPQQRRRNPQTELYNVDRIARAENLDRLPADYSKLPEKPSAQAVPVLGEPLPGDLGKPMLQADRTAAHDDPARIERLNRQRDAEEAAKASVFFRSSSQIRTPPTNSAAPAMAPGMASQLNTPVDPMASLRTASAPADPATLQNRQDQKRAFIEGDGDTATRNPNTLQTPASPYQVMAGTIIPAALVTGINSDLPGQVIANVTEAVYDTATGRHLLIPQGSRLIGRYDSQVAFGQRRVLLVWTRLILPDTSSIALDRLPGIDPAGYAGLEDGVDWHWDRLLAGAALSTLLSVGAELASPNRGIDANDRVIIATRQSTQDTVNQVGQEITRRNLNMQPTLTVRPGFPMRVMVNKDLVLRPYQPLFFQRSSP